MNSVFYRDLHSIIPSSTMFPKDLASVVLFCFVLFHFVWRERSTETAPLHRAMEVSDVDNPSMEEIHVCPVGMPLLAITMPMTG